jgi:hypothetical protein
VYLPPIVFGRILGNIFKMSIDKRKDICYNVVKDKEGIYEKEGIFAVCLNLYDDIGVFRLGCV